MDANNTPVHAEEERSSKEKKKESRKLRRRNLTGDCNLRCVNV